MLSEIEQWKPCPGFEEHYAVSSLGKVMRTKGGRGATVGRILKLQYHPDSKYPMFTLYKNDTGRSYYVHRLVAQAFIPNPLNLPEVNHKKAIKSGGTNYFWNLEWSTHQENVDHAVANDLTPRGEGNGRARLTDEQVISIRNESNKSQRVLAMKYGVSRSTISRVIRGEIWKHVEQPLETEVVA
jgi:NUMOD4 motif/Helix-turn-helix